MRHKCQFRGGLAARLAQMSDAATEQRLRAAGEDFTRAHENAAEVMVEARSAGFTAEAIVLLSVRDPEEWYRSYAI